MILASQLRTGMVIRWEGVTWRVVNADYHAGQGKMGGVCHARLQNLANGSQHVPFKGRIGRIQGTRELVMAPLPWIVVYRVDEVVEMVRVYHGAQDWP